MSSTYGQNLRLTIFGQSHSEAIGVTVEGLPSGFPIDKPTLTQAMAAAEIPATARAEQLGLQEFGRLYEAIRTITE